MIVLCRINRKLAWKRPIMNAAAFDRSGLGTLSVSARLRVGMKEAVRRQCTAAVRKPVFGGCCAG
ncbi:hypothetical protein B2K_39990 [Paenibacillus mucilaginosus K02]|uniref:Uncharacterized protein n=1 Tax=Paenibacillus mucilaginosus K02 TaxID=997761 RepID=R9UPK7_9BACL|nr:hypothetical protein B2K_39990 [Paenibacillus mucilaginosus K02]WFA20535.1 hypothetical protein ERY13_26500 [Paenibacillus mucilaginosus]